MVWVYNHNIANQKLNLWANYHGHLQIKRSKP
jgi:hypothetical protein